MMKTRFKIIISLFIDYGIFAFALTLPSMILGVTFATRSAAIQMITIVFLSGMVGLLVVRDVLFKGTSPGKRLMLLHIYDKLTLQKATRKQLFLCNFPNILFFILGWIDILFILSTGRSLGDRIAHTVVMPENDVSEYRKEQAVLSTPKGKAAHNKSVLKILFIVLGIFFAFFILIQVVLLTQKGTDGYKAAYTYLTESSSFQNMNVPPSAIRLTGVSSSVQSSATPHSNYTTYTFTIKVKPLSFVSISITCHKENETWFVCTECTALE